MSLTREQILAARDFVCTQLGTDFGGQLCDMALAALREQPHGPSERAWIPVSIKWPRLQEPVLLNCGGGVLGELISTGFLRENGGGVAIWAIDADHPSDGAHWIVTHWMPLPAAPYATDGTAK